MRQQENHPDWVSKARCANDQTYQTFLHETKIDIFYEPGMTEFARKFCAGCPVILECQRWATNHQEQGVWGALSQRSRTQKVHNFDKALAEILERSKALLQDGGSNSIAS